MPMSDTTYLTDEPARVPATYWIVAVVGTLWNAFGGYLYVMTRTENRQFLAQSGDPQAIIDWIDSYPLWAQVCWGLGVWGSVLGSVLMLVRSRYAVAAFAVSLLGAIGNFGYQFTHAMPASIKSSGNDAIPFVIIAIVIALWWYCRRAQARGWLR